MNKLFLATSFSTRVDLKSGKVNTKFKEQIETTIQELENAGFDIYCAVEREGWTISYETQEVGVHNDLSEIDKADAEFDGEIRLSEEHNAYKWANQK